MLGYNSLIMSKLLIVDGHAVLHRAYHSIPPLTYNGQPVNAIYGFYSMLLTAIDIINPRYVMVCLDSPGPTLRQQEFIGYRAHRQAPDRELISQLPLLASTLKKADVATYSMGGYEADDLIATVIKTTLKKKPRLKISVITGDKDLMQLVTRQVHLLMPIKGLSQTQDFGPKEVRQKLGVRSSQVVDLKALMGDQSDNYPGVAGIGPKTASNLLQDYKDLDDVYSHLEQIPDSLRSKLESGKDDAYLSYQLAQLVDDIPLKTSFKQARWNQDQMKRLLELFQEYNFKSLASRLSKKLKTKSSSGSPSKDSSQTSLF